MFRLVFVVFLIALTGAYREIEFKNCKTASGSLSCKVKSIKVNGCSTPSSWVDEDGTVIEYEAGEVKNPCRIESGSPLNFSITFEPGSSIETVRSQFTLPDLISCQTPDQCPVDTLAVPGCSYTKCPLEAGRTQRYEITLDVPSTAYTRPVNDRRIYQLRWKLWNNKSKKQSCCFNMPIQY